MNQLPCCFIAYRKSLFADERKLQRSLLNANPLDHRHISRKYPGMTWSGYTLVFVGFLNKSFALLEYFCKFTSQTRMLATSKSDRTMTRRLIYILLLLLLIADTSYSFKQHLSQPLDGDMAWNLIPANDVKPILESPFGFKAIRENITYANPNRFFCHWIYREYLLFTPILFQEFVEPIDSVYLACAISKTVIQIVLIILLAMAITGSTNILKLDFMIAVVLVTPFFQTNGYRSYMGIIDPSTTYTFFYALPCAILLLYLLPFIRQFYFNKKINNQLFIRLLWMPLAFVVCLSGPLNPGIVLIFSILVILPHLIKFYIHTNQKGFLQRVSDTLKKIPNNYWYFLIPICILSLYSLYLGRYNSITISSQIPLVKMYLKIPEGIYYQFTQKLGFPVLFIILAINTVIINIKFKDSDGKKILKIFKWIGIFSLCYILLLPLGGYRYYRPYILRYDTIMPITLSLIFIFGISTLFLINKMSKKYKMWYLPIIIGVIFIFTYSDEPKFDHNICERSALEEIGNTQETIVALKEDCSVVAWEKFNTPEESELNAQLLNIWGITKEKKLYFNR
jgi:hypothetical protein